jgi:hypothetical protein
MMNVSMITAGASAGDELSAVTPLSDRFDVALARSYVAAGDEQAAIRAAANDPYTASHPEALFQLQVKLEEYTKAMTITAGLANHAVKTVETLLKS